MQAILDFLVWPAYAGAAYCLIRMWFLGKEIRKLLGKMFDRGLL